MAFGPEVLAASSIMGTKRGGKKNDGGTQKPALNRTILDAVRGNKNGTFLIVYCKLHWLSYCLNFLFLHRQTY